MAEQKKPMNYPGNSKTPAEPQPEAKPEIPQVKPMTTAKRRKKTFFGRIKETLVVDDTQSVGSYVFFEVMVPATKNLVADMTREFVERVLFGDGRPSGGRRNNYNSMSSGGPRSNYQDRMRPTSSFNREDRSSYEPNRRARHDFSDIVIPSRGEAEKVLDFLLMTVDTYNVVTVQDFYNLVGITPDFMDAKYGWSNLDAAGIHRVGSHEYIIELPRPEELR